MRLRTYGVMETLGQSLNLLDLYFIRNKKDLNTEWGEKTKKCTDVSWLSKLPSWPQYPIRHFIRYKLRRDNDLLLG